MDVVEADHRHVFRHSTAVRLQGGDRADGAEVVGGEDRGEFERLPEEPFDASVAAILGEVARHPQAVTALHAGGAQGRPVSGQSFPAYPELWRTGDMGDRPVAKGQQVLGGERRSGSMVYVDLRRARKVDIPVKRDKRDPAAGKPFDLRST